MATECEHTCAIPKERGRSARQLPSAALGCVPAQRHAFTRESAVRRSAIDACSDCGDAQHAADRAAIDSGTCSARGEPSEQLIVRAMREACNQCGDAQYAADRAAIDSGACSARGEPSGQLVVWGAMCADAARLEPFIPPWRCCNIWQVPSWRHFLDVLKSIVRQRAALSLRLLRYQVYPSARDAC